MIAASAALQSPRSRHDGSRKITTLQHLTFRTALYDDVKVLRIQIIPKSDINESKLVATQGKFKSRNRLELDINVSEPSISKLDMNRLPQPFQRRLVKCLA